MSDDDANKFELFETMLLVRRFEEALIELHATKAFSGHFHVCIGQEATAAVTMGMLEAKDRITTTHRNHGHVISRGVDVRAALAEILGRSTGMNSGYAGTFHLTAPELGFLSTSGIVGGAISLAVGGGYACRQKGDSSLTAALFGDGALEEGVAFEALNLAALWKLPVLFLCENNDAALWSGDARSAEHAVKDLCDLPRLCGIATASVNGVDIDAVAAALRKGVAHCRSGEGPYFLEMRTMRWPGNYTQFPTLATGRTDLDMAFGRRAIPTEHERWYREDDPVLKLARDLVAQDEAAASRLVSIDESVTDRIREAVQFAVESPWPDPSAALDHVFA